MIKTYKVQLKPNNKQVTKLHQYACMSRFAYNWALAKQMESLKNNNGLISDSELRKEFTRLKQSPEYNWLNDVNCDVAKQAIKDLCNAFIRYFKLKKKPEYKPYSKKFLAHMKRIGKQPTVYHQRDHPKFKCKKNWKPSFYQDVFKISFTDTHCKLALSAGNSGSRHRRQCLNNIKLAEKSRIPLDKKYSNPRITFDGLHWWLSVGVETDVNHMDSKTDGLGIDLGIKDLAVCSDSTKYKNINKTKEVRRLTKKERRLQRSISRKYEMNNNNNLERKSYRKTKNVIKKEKALLKIQHRLTNIRTNYMNQTINDIVNRKPRFVCIEDLNVLEMMSNKHLSKAVQDQKFYEFRLKLTNKCNENEIPIVIADRFYPSSKMCCKCGNIKHDLKLRDRIYKCNVCNNVIDRDYQASLNLMQYGFNKLYA